MAIVYQTNSRAGNDGVSSVSWLQSCDIDDTGYDKANKLVMSMYYYSDKSHGSDTMSTMPYFRLDGGSWTQITTGTTVASTSSAGALVDGTTVNTPAGCLSASSSQEDTNGTVSLAVSASTYGELQYCLDVSSVGDNVLIEFSPDGGTTVCSVSVTTAAGETQEWEDRNVSLNLERWEMMWRQVSLNVERSDEMWRNISLNLQHSEPTDRNVSLSVEQWSWEDRNISLDLESVTEALEYRDISLSLERFTTEYREVSLNLERFDEEYRDISLLLEQLTWEDRDISLNLERSTVEYRDVSLSLEQWSWEDRNISLNFQPQAQIDYEDRTTSLNLRAWSWEDRDVSLSLELFTREDRDISLSLALPDREYRSVSLSLETWSWEDRTVSLSTEVYALEDRTISLNIGLVGTEYREVSLSLEAMGVEYRDISLELERWTHEDRNVSLNLQFTTVEYREVSLSVEAWAFEDRTISLNLQPQAIEGLEYRTVSLALRAWRWEDRNISLAIANLDREYRTVSLSLEAWGWEDRSISIALETAGTFEDRAMSLSLETYSFEDRTVSLEVSAWDIEDRTISLSTEVWTTEDRDISLLTRAWSWEERQVSLNFEVFTTEDRDISLSLRYMDIEDRNISLDLRYTALEYRNISLNLNWADVEDRDVSLSVESYDYEDISMSLNFQPWTEEFEDRTVSLNLERWTFEDRTVSLSLQGWGIEDRDVSINLRAWLSEYRSISLNVYQSGGEPSTGDLIYADSAQSDKGSTQYINPEGWSITTYYEWDYDAAMYVPTSASADNRVWASASAFVHQDDTNWIAGFGSGSDLEDLPATLDIEHGFEADADNIYLHSSGVKNTVEDWVIYWSTVGGGLTGGGNTGYIPKWSTATSLTDSIYTEQNIIDHFQSGTRHFLEGDIDHTNIQNIGSNSHADIDTHISDTSIHYEKTTISIDDLDDVNEGTPDDGDVLTYDTGSSMWISEAPVGGGDHGALTGLDDDDHSAIYPAYSQDETITGNWTFSGTQRIGTTVEYTGCSAGTWYRIAYGVGGRQTGRFIIADTGSSHHGIVEFIARASYAKWTGDDGSASITVLNHTKYDNDGISGIRMVVHDDDYSNPPYLEFYAGYDGDYQVIFLDESPEGWNNWTLYGTRTSGSIPAGYTGMVVSQPYEQHFVIQNLGGKMFEIGIDGSVDIAGDVTIPSGSNLSVADSDAAGYIRLGVGVDLMSKNTTWLHVRNQGDTAYVGVAANKLYSDNTPAASTAFTRFIGHETGSDELRSRTLAQVQSDLGISAGGPTTTIDIYPAARINGTDWSWISTDEYLESGHDTSLDTVYFYVNLHSTSNTIYIDGYMWVDAGLLTDNDVTGTASLQYLTNGGTWTVLDTDVQTVTAVTNSTNGDNKQWTLSFTAGWTYERRYRIMFTKNVDITADDGYARIYAISQADV